MTTITDMAANAQEVFHRNVDTLIAGYLIRHPDTDPADVTLVFQQLGGSLRFSIEPRELHVPAQNTYNPQHDDTSNTPLEFARKSAYADGWNDCRAAMIAEATPQGVVMATTLDGKPVEVTNG